MGFSRREILRGLVSTSYWDDLRRRRRLPPDQDIHLDSEACIAWGRGICVSCEHVCPERAIVFVGMMNPRLHLARCTLCGDCVPVCPTDAIVMRNDPKQAGKKTS